MKKFRSAFQVASLLVPLLILSALPVAEAQGPPPLCNPATAADFEKTVAFATGGDRDGSGSYTPGDIIEYEMTLCNTGAAACVPGWTDNLDELLTLPADLTFSVNPATLGCAGTPPDGGALCFEGPLGGPFTVPASVTRCGQDCGAPSDTVGFVVSASDPTKRLQPGRCFNWIVQAQISAAITSSKCLCNTSGTLIDFSGGKDNTNDPNWVTLQDGTPGCNDAQTCPLAGECNTCVKVAADVDLTASTKCVDTTTPTCGTGVSKTPGATVRYLFEVRNTGTLTASNVSVSDPLDFVSTPSSAPCLNIAAAPTMSAVTCTPGPCAGTPSVTWTSPTITASLGNLAPGVTASFEVTVPVNAAANGTCTNNWTLQYIPGGSPRVVPTTAPTFIVDSGASIEASKCIDEGTTCGTGVARAESDPVRYIIQYENVGDLAAQSVTLVDDLGAMGPSCGVTRTSPVTCVPQAATCGSITCTVVAQPSPGVPFRATLSGDMQPGCIVDVVMNFTVNVGDTGSCCNQATAEYRDSTGPRPTATSPDACFDVAAATVAVTKTARALTVGVGQPATFDIVIHNERATAVASGDVSMADVFPVCFEPLGTAGAPCASPLPYTCTGTGCAGSTCVYAAGGLGFNLTNFTLAADDGAAGGADEMQITLTATAGATVGGCTNTATVSDRGGPLDTAAATVTIEDVALEVVKTVSPLTVAPTTGTATFTIVVTNNTTGPFTGCTLSDTVPGCTTLTAASCSSTPVIAVGCAASPVTATFNLAAGASQEITFDVIAGATLGDCINSVAVTCGSERGSDDATLRITDVSGCDLNRIDAVTWAPMTPAKTGDWVYTLDCGATVDKRVDPAYPVLGGVAATNPATGDSFGSSAAGSPSLLLYQRACDCTEVIKLVKNGVGGIRITF